MSRNYDLYEASSLRRTATSVSTSFPLRESPTPGRIEAFGADNARAWRGIAQTKIQIIVISSTRDIIINAEQSHVTWRYGTLVAMTLWTPRTYGRQADGQAVGRRERGTSVGKKSYESVRYSIRLLSVYQLW